MCKFQIEERIVQLLQHFGLDQVHVAARLDTDWIDLVAHRPELITSLPLIYPGDACGSAPAPGVPSPGYRW